MSAPHVNDASFRYTTATKTNIRKTFARIKKQLAEEAAHKPPSKCRGLHCQKSLQAAG
jgi:hypothetical protein